MIAQKEEEILRKMKEAEMVKKVEEKKKKGGGRKLVVKKGGIKKKARAPQELSAQKPSSGFPEDSNKLGNMPDPNFGARKAAPVEMDDFPEI